MQRKPAPPQEHNEAHLVEFLRQARGDVDTEFQGAQLPASNGPAAKVTLSAPALPSVFAKLAQLERLDLLREEVLFSLLAVSPTIDEHHIYRALRAYLKGWTFDPTDFSMVAILAKEKGATIAALKLDLLTDDITLLARKKGMLEVAGVLPVDRVLAVMRQPGTTPDRVWDWFQVQFQEVVRMGKEG